MAYDGFRVVRCPFLERMLGGGDGIGLAADAGGLLEEGERAVESDGKRMVFRNT